MALKSRADAADKMTRDEVLDAYPTAFTSLGYDPMTAQYLDRIQASRLALSDGDHAVLGQHGFVISAAHQFPSMLRGYTAIYSEDLPVYISADAVLDSVHRSYDAVLLKVELTFVFDQLTQLLQRMRMRLPTVDASPDARADADVYLAVALTLLQGQPAAPVAGGDAATIALLVAQAQQANGTAMVQLFGTQRLEDFSQFTPRGHYTQGPQLEGYFRAMMWLGRIDLRLIETRPDGSQVFNREQFEAMLVLRDALGSDLPTWQHIDDVLQFFVGKSDNMIVPEVDRLLTDLGGAQAARSASDNAIEKALVEGGYGRQEIASYLMVNDGTVDTLPLNRSFLLFGQRYIVDSNVFSAVVYDRVPDPNRLMPDPLEAAFGALGNNQALALDPELPNFEQLPGALARVRVLVDSNDTTFWDSSLYNLWVSSLRALSPANAATDAETGLPKVATTEAWGRRILNTQLGSWAQLRHDTLLYAKASYSGIPACDFPDAYVDPYPEVFAAIGRYAALGLQLTTLLPNTTPGVRADIEQYYTALAKAAAVLQQIAAAERAGEALTSEQLAFINDAVRITSMSVVCTSIDVPNGWLAKLYYDPRASLEFDPTIADVHTQPADAGGNIVGNVLHVGTGYPRLMVATTDSCGGSPRAYAGVVFAYHEQTTSNFMRMSDLDWAAKFRNGAPPTDVAWLSNVVGH